MWLYENTKDNKARFVLGEKGERPLICFGVNPSTAIPDKLDRTLTQVQRKSMGIGYDGWIMFNLYPQRATNPKDLHKELVNDIHNKNLKVIKKIFSHYPNSTIWAAWGGIIKKRAFLKDCLKDIVSVMPKTVNWVHIAAKKHPHHPLYLKKDSRFISFDINKYLEDLGRTTSK